jgi:DNA polymerase-3 subunit alpha
VWISGVVVDSRAQMTRRGMMRVVELDDGSGRMEVTVFNELYESRRSVLKVDEPLIVSAKVEHDDYSGSLRGTALEILTLAEARLRYAKGVRLTVEAKSAQQAQALIARLQGGLTPEQSAGLPVFLCLMMAGQQCELRLGNAWCVAADSSSLDALGRQFQGLEPELIGESAPCLEIVYRN